MTWQEELKKSLRTKADFEQFFQRDFPDLPYGVFLTRSLALKIKESGFDSSLSKQFLPHKNELKEQGLLDPIGDELYLKAPGLIHRYRTRALFFPTKACPIVCRYCFRKNEIHGGSEIFRSDFQKTLAYLQEHPEIEEIIYSGGDPLIVSTKKLRESAEAFRKVGIKYLRFHTRTPLVMPSRVDEELIEFFQWCRESFEAFHISLHTNHLDEIGKEEEKAIKKMSCFSLLSQTVLLKGVNNSERELTYLFKKLMSLNVRPYYLHHPDKAQGAEHFRVSLEEGRRIYAKLRQTLPGWALPHYIIDIPGGEGKVSAFNPESFEFSGKLISKNGDLIKIDISDL